MVEELGAHGLRSIVARARFSTCVTFLQHFPDATIVTPHIKNAESPRSLPS